MVIFQSWISADTALMSVLLLPQIVIDSCTKDQVYVACRWHTSEFPYCGYLRSDLTWGLSMRMADGSLGYFNSKAEAIQALKNFV